MPQRSRDDDSVLGFFGAIFGLRPDDVANPSFNPDAASTGNFLFQSFGFLVPFQRAAVGTAG
jgi:hypothetical protein